MKNHKQSKVQSLKSPTLDSQKTLDPLDVKPINDCWNTIGVSGNGTCRELTLRIHCRNCPVYSAAALELLEQPVRDDDRQEWTEHFAREKQLSQPHRTSVVIFRVAGEWLALPTTAFQEVASGISQSLKSPTLASQNGRQRLKLHSLPHRRGGMVLGLVNVRGELLICVSLARTLGLADSLKSEVQSPKSPTLDSRLETLDSQRTLERLLVTNWEGQRLAFPVDEVYGVHRFDQEELRRPPATLRGVEKVRQHPESRIQPGTSYTRGIFPWRDRMVGFLAADVLFATLNRNLC